MIRLIVKFVNSFFEHVFLVVTVLEQAAETAANYPLRHVESEDVKGEDIKKLLGALVK